MSVMPVSYDFYIRVQPSGCVSDVDITYGPMSISIITLLCIQRFAYQYMMDSPYQQIMDRTNSKKMY